MRYFLSVLLLSALTCGINRAETPIQKNGYFCAKQGTVLHYERYAPDGKHWWNQVTKIDSGGSSYLSPKVKPGDTLEEIHGKVECAGMKLSIDYTERKVLRRETITVPAGTFDCIVVQERKVEKAPLMKRDNITLTWYCLGYGFVRHDSLLPDGSLESSELLVSISN